MNFKYYTDEHGIRRANVDPPYELLGWYLEDDVQGSLYTCKLLFSVIEKVKRGVESEWKRTGNAHTITISPEKVLIENEYLIESEQTPSRESEIPFIEFEKALKQWFEFIKVGQEELLAWVESEFNKDPKEMDQIRAQRIQRKLMVSKKKRNSESTTGKT